MSAGIMNFVVMPTWLTVIPHAISSHWLDAGYMTHLLLGEVCCSAHRRKRVLTIRTPCATNQMPGLDARKLAVTVRFAQRGRVR